MAYAPPTGNVLDFTWVGKSAYTPPVWNSVSFVFPLVAFTVDIAATIPVVAAQSVNHGTALAGVATIPVTAEMSLTYTGVNVEIDIAAAIPVVAAADAVHGVSASGVASIAVTAGMEAVHGVAASILATVPVTALQSVVHGIALDGIATIPVSASAALVHERYELRGEVRLNGILVNRRVRAYLRSSGALLGESDTVIGKFKVPAGFAPVECYVTPIDLSSDATDWLPPTANRITSVLAMDTA